MLVFRGGKAYTNGGTVFQNIWTWETKRLKLLETSRNRAGIFGHSAHVSTNEKYMTSSGCKPTASVSMTHGDVHQFLRR